MQRTKSVFKNTLIIFLLPLLLMGCSKKESEEANILPSTRLPFQITVVETPEAQEQQSISNLAAGYLETKNYDKLEALAAQYRSSKEEYADGNWKLQFIYNAFELPDEATESDCQERQKKIEEWVDARPNSLTARIVMARFFRDYAWNARGSDYANTVSDKAWQLFSGRLNKAVEVLNEAENLNEKCPFYWSTMMGVGLGLQTNKEKYNDIFKQAIEVEPDFEAYYDNRAIFLLPRWYGADGEWENDLAQSADRIGGEDGDMLYARVVWSIHDYGSSQNVFRENPQISWDRVDR
jgi:hypothetical protein